MEVSLFDSSTVYYGSQFVHRSHDGGVHWETISPDLTANPAVLSGRQRRADHARRHRRRVLQHALRDQRIEARAGRHLDGLERRAVLRHARQWQDVEEHHAEGSADRRPRAVHRDVAASQRLGLLRGVSLSPRRLRAVHLQDRRLRRDVEAADRWQERHSRGLADARRARRSRSRGIALRRHRVRDVHLVRQRRALAALRSEHAERADHTTSNCITRISSSPRRVARCGFSTT